MISQHLIDFLRAWYPDHYDCEVDRKFMAFMSELSAFIPLNVPLDSRLPRIMLTSETTAFTDLSDIFIPGAWLTPEYGKRLLNHINEDRIPESAVILTLFNGGVLHELGHIINSKSLMSLTAAQRRQSGVFEAITQVVEDIFIERWWALHNGVINNFHTALCQLFFSTDIAEKVNDTFIDAMSRGYSQESCETYIADDIIELLVSFKNEQVLEWMRGTQAVANSPALSGIIENLDRLHGDSTDGERLAIIKSISKIIDGIWGGVKVSSEPMASSAMVAANISMSSPSYEAQIKLAREMVDLMNDAISECELRDSERRVIETTNEPVRMVEADEKFVQPELARPDDLRRQMPIDRRFLVFARLLDNMRATKGGFAPLSNTGKIDRHRLYRIALDGKIMRRRDDTDGDQRVDLEVIQLVDWSGSMDVTDEFLGLWDGSIKPESRYLSYRLAFTGAAVGVAQALTTTGIPNALFAHTIKPAAIGEFEVVVPRIYSFKMKANTRAISVNDIGYAATLVSREYSGLGNSDHLAIREAAKNFTSKRNVKLLIVYSDGQPTPKGYAYPANVQITRAEISKLRSKGVLVMSVSVLEDVWKSNDEIYGGGNNVKLNSSSDVTAELTKVLRRLSVKG